MSFACAGDVLASTIQGEQEDVDQAVAAAKTAYESWSKTPGHVRARYLYRYALLEVGYLHTSERVAPDLKATSRYTPPPVRTDTVGCLCTI